MVSAADLMHSYQFHCNEDMQERDGTHICALTHVNVNAPTDILPRKHRLIHHHEQYFFDSK